MPEHKKLPRTEGHWVTDGLIALLLFLLFTEWLRPLAEMAQLTNPDLIRPFLVAIGCFVFVEYIGLPAMLAWFLKIVLCVFTDIYLFLGISSDDSGIANRYISLALEDGTAFLHGHFGSISPEGRTFLFLLGWTLFVSLVYSAISYKRNGFWFAAFTIFYLIGLQLWPGLDTNAGLVRASAAGLLFLALLNLPRLEIKYDLSRKWAVLPTAWVAVSALLVAALVAAGLFVSESQPREVKPVQWIDDLPFFQSAFGDHAETAGVRLGRTGYGEDDSRLGGGLVQDNKIVFLARTDRPTYWRGESKINYDGKGWTQPETGAELQNVDLPVPPAIGDSVSGGKEASAAGSTGSQGTAETAAGSTGSQGTIETAAGSTITQEVLLSDNKQEIPMFTGGLITSFDAVVTSRGHMLSGESIMVDPETGKYSLQPGQLLSYYKVRVRQPEEDGNELRNDNLPYPQQSDSRYLQLPADLPDRVKRLAEDIIAAQNNNYDRVKAVETYLRDHYAYDLRKPDYPAAGEDFTDHFLFKQKVGYCDHFSTAMVVMLRSVGIPARWVKGFAPGDVSDEAAVKAETASSPENRLPAADVGSAQEHKPITVTVRNLHAHSWVEVYFPRHGWIPFEPTPGFQGFGEESGTGQAVNADERTVPAAAAVGSERSEPQQTRPAEKHMEQTAGKGTTAVAGESLRRKSADWLNHAAGTTLAPLMQTIRKMNWGTVASAAAAASLLAGAVWLGRRRLLLWMMLRNYRRSARNAELAVKILDRLWLIAFRTYGRKQDHFTLREYVESLSFQDKRKTEALKQFLELYENIRYGASQRISLSRKTLSEAWRKMRTQL